jgi:membrane-bound lytic murein transglycosylase D
MIKEKTYLKFCTIVFSLLITTSSGFIQSSKAASKKRKSGSNLSTLRDPNYVSDIWVKDQGDEPAVPYSLTAGPSSSIGTESTEDDFRGIEKYKNRIRIKRSKNSPLLSKLPREIVEDFNEEIIERVRFWVDIFGRYNNYQAVIHDKKYIDIVYDVLDLEYIYSNSNYSEVKKRKLAKAKILKEQKRYSNLLRDIHNQKNEPWMFTKEQNRIYELFYGIQEEDKFLEASKLERIRGQLGLKDQTIEGMRIAGRYNDQIISIFKKHNLPLVLTKLPYVESSFNVNAVSKVGASGVWQFMPSSGRFFGLKVNDVLDERNDPILATEAAAKHLKRNYEKLGTWPLAITAYNFGLGNIKRAIRKVGSNKLSDIISNYESKRFGFASSNFYASFLAAVIVDKDRIKYFGHIKPYKPIKYQVYSLPRYVSLEVVESHTKLEREFILNANPSIGTAVREGKKWLPKNFKLKIPNGSFKKFSKGFNRIPASRLFSQQRKSKYHKVRSGQTLGLIARKYRVNLSKLLKTNKLNVKSRIYPGQKIKIPWK